MDMMWLGLGTLSFFAPALSWMMQYLSYIFSPLDSQVMFSHALSYQSMMPVNAPQVNATTTVVVSKNASRVGPIVGLPNSPSSTLLLPSLAGWLWPIATEHYSFCHWCLPKHLSFILLCATYPWVGVHLSWCVDGLDSGRVLLHPNPVFCQLSHKCMSQPDRDIIWPNRGKRSRNSNISTDKMYRGIAE